MVVAAASSQRGAPHPPTNQLGTLCAQLDPSFASILGPSLRLGCVESLYTLHSNVDQIEADA